MTYVEPIPVWIPLMQFFLQLAAMLALSGVIALVLVLAALWVWDLAIEFITPIRRWNR